MGRKELALLVAVLFLAAVLRMGWPGLTEFKADEAHMMTLALDMVEGQRFPLRGMASSVGFPNFPMSVWIYALPLLVWKHVYAATLFTGLLNTLAVLGCWGFVRRYWGREAALAAALMFAVSPWAVIFSRKIWAQNLLPFFVMIWVTSAALALVERRPWFILLHLLSLAVVVQIHLSGVGLVFASAMLLLLFRRRVNWQLALLGGVLAALTALPLVYSLLSGAALPVTQGFEGGADLKSFRYTWLISLGYEIHSLAGPETFRNYLATAPDISAVHWLWGALVLGGMGWLGWRGRGEREVEVGLLVLVWGLAPPLFFVWHSTPVFPHYFIITYPAQYIAAGVAGAALVRRLHGWRWAGWIVLGTSAAAQVWVWAVLLAFVSGRATPGGFGAPLKMQLAAAELAQRMLVEELAAEVLVVGPGESPELDEFAAVHSVLLRPAPHRFVAGDRSAVFPAEPAIVLLAPAPGRQAERYLSPAGRTARVELRPGEGALHLLTLPGNSAPAPDFAFQAPHTFANGVDLLGYNAPTPNNNAAVWQIYWRTGAPAETDYHFFNHLMDANGQRVSQADAAAFFAGQWRAGDTVVSRFVLPWPAEAARPSSIRTGMYTYPALENVPVLDAAGNPSAGAVQVILSNKIE